MGVFVTKKNLKMDSLRALMELGLAFLALYPASDGKNGCWEDWTCSSLETASFVV